MNYPIKIYFIWFFSLFFILYTGFILVPKGPYASDNFFEALLNWDSRYYISIAQFGYLKSSHYAFFPGYPLAIKYIGLLSGNFQLSTILISNLSTFLACVVLYKLILLDFTKRIARQSLIFLLFFPTSFYLVMGYSEGLFLLLSVLTIYFFRKGNFFMATIFANLLSITRVTGLVLILSIIIHLIITRQLSKKNWIMLLSPLAFLIYCFYLYIQTQNPFYFLVSQTEWRREIGFPWLGYWQAIINLFQSNFIQKYYYVIFDLLFAIFGLGMAIRSFRFLPAVYPLYALGSVLLPLLTTNLSSMPRFLLPVFPIFILIALIKKRLFKIIYLIISVILLVIFSSLFINGYWVG